MAEEQPRRRPSQDNQDVAHGTNYSSAGSSGPDVAKNRSAMSRMGTGALQRAGSVIRAPTPGTPGGGTRGSLLQRAATGALFTDDIEDEHDCLVPESEASLMHKLKSAASMRDPNAKPPQSITWKDVSFSVKIEDPDNPKKKMDLTILESNCGHVKGGTLTAFMGPSGCGKSTLLDIIAQKKTAKYEGTVYTNGIPVDKHYQDRMAYVGQEDLMHQFMTVYEVVRFTANLKSSNSEGRTADIERVLDEMGLLHVKGSRIGGPAVRGISGGQRRRVSLARGVVSNAQMMFLDEPTTGLSSTDAELCVRVLKDTAKRYAITILVVIHQPRVEVARLFDQLILLCARPGRIVYNGPMSEVAGYCAGVGHPVPRGSNFADHILDVITPGGCGADPDAFADWYREKLLPGVRQKVDDQLAAPIGPILSAPKGSAKRFSRVCYEFRIVFGRELMLLRQDKRVILSSIVVSWIKSILLGLMFQGVGETEPQGISQMSFLYVLMLTISLGSLEQIVRLIEVRDIMKLEVDQRLYGIGVYIVASSIVQVTLALLGSSVFLVTMFLFSGMAAKAFPLIFGWSTMVFAVFISFTALIAAAAKNQPAAQAIALPGILLMVMVSGIFITKKSAPVYLEWMLYISPIALAMELLAKGIFKDDPIAFAMLQMNYGYDEDASETYFICICLGFAFVFRVGQALCTVYLNKIQR